MIKSYMPWIHQALVFTLVALGCGVASANDVYLAQSGVGSNNGSSCANALAYGYFNTAGNWTTSAPTGTKIGPGTVVHLCGTITGAAGADNFLVFQGSGTSGNPITLLWETDAIVQAPYFALGISASGRSYVTIDGGTNGIIRNSANGDALTYKSNSQLMDVDQCDNCTVKNLEMGPTFVHVRDTQEVGSGYDHQQILVGKFSGSNFLFDKNKVHDCGWCVNHTYHAGQSSVTYSNNEIWNFDHGLSLYPVVPNATLTNVFISQNRLHDAAIWDCGMSGGIPNCHHDSIHIFSSPTDTNTITGLYGLNNYFYGSMGKSTTGFIYLEGATSPAHIVTSYWWNNVALVSNVEETSGGWMDLFSGSTSTVFVNNTLIAGGAFTDPGGNAITNCYAVGYATMPFTFKNNVGAQCSGMINSYNATASASDWDYNYYGLTCSALQTYDNCFAYDSSGFLGSFSNWRSTTGRDAHSVNHTTSPTNPAAWALWNSNGSPTTGNPVIGAGTNLSSIATGYLASLAYDTTLGGTRTPVARPSSGPWDIGAFAVTSGGTSVINPPTGVSAVAR